MHHYLLTGLSLAGSVVAGGVGARVVEGGASPLSSREGAGWGCWDEVVGASVGVSASSAVVVVSCSSGSCYKSHGFQLGKKVNSSPRQYALGSHEG